LNGSKFIANENRDCGRQSRRGDELQSAVAKFSEPKEKKTSSCVVGQLSCSLILIEQQFLFDLYITNHNNNNKNRFGEKYAS
jgi:hypothetical protein